MQEFEALLVVGVSFLGVIGSVAYYFARFYAFFFWGGGGCRGTY